MSVLEPLEPELSVRAMNPSDSAVVQKFVAKPVSRPICAPDIKLRVFMVDMYLFFRVLGSRERFHKAETSRRGNFSCSVLASTPLHHHHRLFIQGRDLVTLSWLEHLLPQMHGPATQYFWVRSLYQ
jgi:hypothetical protein